MSLYEELAKVLNALSEEEGVEVTSMTFSKSDVPIDWDDDEQRWEWYE